MLVLMVMTKQEPTIALKLVTANRLKLLVKQLLHDLVITYISELGSQWFNAVVQAIKNLIVVLKQMPVQFIELIVTSSQFQAIEVK